MCRPSPVPVATSSCPPETYKFKFDTTFLRYTTAVWLPLVFPPGGLLNEGFTRWWLRIAIAYMLIRNKDLCRFQAVLGLVINVGWYAASFVDYFFYGHQIGNVLLRNVRGLREITIAGSLSADQLDLVGTPLAISCRFLSLLLDLLLHPGMCYYFWRVCWKSRLTLDEIATWRVMCCTFLLSRCWSATQVFARYGKFGLYYYGHHVYYLPPDGDHLWTCGYVGEFVTYAAISAFKLYKIHQRSKKVVVDASTKIE